jgi:hypothetical protein
MQMNTAAGSGTDVLASIQAHNEALGTDFNQFYDRAGARQDESNQKATLASLAESFDVRHISPRQMKDLAEALYFEADAISFHEYTILSYQPEVDDDNWYVLTGNIAQPDGPRDFVEEWVHQLEYQKMAGGDPDEIRRALENIDKVLGILHGLDGLRRQRKLA